MAVAVGTHGLFTWFVGFFEHVAAVFLGVFLMIVGLGMSVTMVMLPVGLTIGLLGVGILVAGLFGRAGHLG